MTNGEKYGPAMRARTQQVADECFAALVAHSMSFGNTREEAERIERSNIGYWAGYYDNETRRRVERLFRCSHPVFGPCEPLPEEAYLLGLDAGRQTLEEKQGDEAKRRS